MTGIQSFLILLTSFVLLGLIGCKTKPSGWQPASGPLFSKWAAEISPDSVHQEYPRPQMVREEWLNLNGLWDYVIRPKGEDLPANYDGRILVPFPVESALSGVMEAIGPENELWYHRRFNLKKGWTGGERRLLLHFGAVDWETTVWINGNSAGSHKGGYDAFSFDITDHLIPDAEQEIIVRVWDPADKGTQPRGKQVSKPRGIWYTSVTGIWQTVWLEPVQQTHIQSLKIHPDIDHARLDIDLFITAIRPDQLIISTLFLDGKELSQVHTKSGNRISFDIEDQKLWTPDSPVLYDLDIRLVESDGRLIDQIQSYAGMRKISVEKFGSQTPRIFLNNEFVFQLGPLDQGWWPDGLYTAPSDAALKYDIEVTKKLGFNMARKHVKVEPARWYYWCDKLGLMVWQDMPSGDQYIGRDDADIVRSPESAAQFETELKEIVTQFGNHPSIVIWVPFNEGWGQYDTERIVDYLKSIDPSRLVINTSGWADRGVGDIHDIHAYPGPAMPEPEKKRALVLGEFGGLGLPLKGHTWQSADNWGYRSYQNASELTQAYANLFVALHPLIGKGLSAAVYTQTTDVEVEVNGLMTYDRALIKIDPDTLKRINQGYLPPVIKSTHDILISTLTITLVNEIQQGEIHYSLDGTTPGKESAIYNKPLVINDTKTVRAITVFADGTVSGLSEKIFKKVTPAESVADKNLAAGLMCSYFELDDQNLSHLPDFDVLKEKSSAVGAGFDLKTAERAEYFALRFTGFIRLPAEGIYRFYVESDDGSKLFIHDRLIVDNDGVHGMIEKSGDMALKKGLHPLRLDFFQGRGQSSSGKGLVVRIAGPSLQKQALPASMLFHE